MLAEPVADRNGGRAAGALDPNARSESWGAGTQAIAYHRVDNPLVRMADPLLLGFLVTHDTEIGTKVVHKARPDERLGTVGQREGRIHVTEYTELAREDAEPRADEVLPLHASPKPIPCPDAERRAVAPREPNGYKLERFVFDLHAEARALVMVEARREDEYAPVKRADGGESTASARLELEACTRRWLAAASWKLPPDSVPLDHSVIDGPEDAALLAVRDATVAAPVVRLGPGVIR